jgi:hypothetical protein
MALGTDVIGAGQWYHPSFQSRHKLEASRHRLPALSESNHRDAGGIIKEFCATIMPTFPHLQLMIPAESAHDTIEALGDVGLLQFKDLNTDKSAFQRNYASQVRAAVV